MAPPSFNKNRWASGSNSHPASGCGGLLDRGQERLERLLVPYAANIHDELGLELA